MEVFVSDVDSVVILERIRLLSAVQMSSKGLSVVSGIYWQLEAKPSIEEELCKDVVGFNRCQHHVISPKHFSHSCQQQSDYFVSKHRLASPQHYANDNIDPCCLVFQFNR